MLYSQNARNWLTDLTQMYKTEIVGDLSGKKSVEIDLLVDYFINHWLFVRFGNYRSLAFVLYYCEVSNGLTVKEAKDIVSKWVYLNLAELFPHFTVDHYQSFIEVVSSEFNKKHKQQFAFYKEKKEMEYV